MDARRGETCAARLDVRQRDRPCMAGDAQIQRLKDDLFMVPKKRLLSSTRSFGAICITRFQQTAGILKLFLQQLGIWQHRLIIRRHDG